VGAILPVTAGMGRHHAERLLSQNEALTVGCALLEEERSRVCRRAALSTHACTGETAHILLPLACKVPAVGDHKPPYRGCAVWAGTRRGRPHAGYVAQEHPVPADRRVVLLVGIAMSACLGAGYQVGLQRVTPVTLLSIVGLGVLLLAQLQSLAIRPRHAGTRRMTGGVNQPCRPGHGCHAATDVQRTLHGS